MTSDDRPDGDLREGFEERVGRVSQTPLRGGSVLRAAPPTTSLDALAAPMDELSAILDSLVPEEAQAFVRRHRWAIAGTLVVGLLTELVPQAPWIVIVPLLVAIAGLRLDRRLPFGFGEGFIGPRTDLGWPSGVQEDDDVHWTWRPIARVR